MTPDSTFLSELPEVHAGALIRTQETLEVERQNIRRLFDHAPGFVAILGGNDFIHEYGNPVLHEILGGDVTGRKLRDVVPDADSSGFFDIVDRVYQTGEPALIEEMPICIGGDARYFDASYTARRNAQGDVDGIMCWGSDVTSRVIARRKREDSERRLRKSEERLSTAIAVANLGFYDWDITNDRIIFSDQMLNDWGISSVTTLEDALDRIHPDDRTRTRDLILAAIHGRTSYHTQYRVVRSAASVIWIEAHGTVTYDDQGRPVRFFGTSIDITDQIKKQQELEQAKRAAEQAKDEAVRANSSKTSFLANMSHEIRTPMAAILGFTELLQNTYMSADRRQDALWRIERSGRGLLKLIDDILDISKIEAGKLSTERSAFSPSELVQEVTSLLALQAEQKSLILKTVVHSSVPRTAHSDAARVRQILTNLIGNAIKFTPAGEVVTEVTTEAGSADGKEFLVFHVTDSGIGIADSDQDRLFHPFVQADESIRRKFGGTGLGLMLSKRLAEELGGDLILAESKLNKGSRFTLRIEASPFENPAPQTSPAQRATEKPAPRDPSGSLAGLHVLVVDDMPDNQLLLSCFLKSAGAQVDLASGGEEAISKALSRPYDMVLMDIQMPHVDGIQATKRLRSSGYLAPILALTAHAMREDVLRSLEAGCDDHLTKPISKDQLVAVIRRHVKSLSPGLF